ncbi:MAG: hypothetical protein DMF78_21870 [Acidobacteria bacterium]|nr:MAG: hypothetical protein DMF78_21870 [Acidobacteriota bacterium]
MATAGELRARVRQALAEQRRVVARLLRQRAQLQGSLLVRHMECGKPGCACHTGRKHGPYFVLSNRSGGRGAYAYLDAARASRARALVRRYREFRRGLQRLQKVNVELVALLRRYQQAQLKSTGRRLGVPVSARA